MIECATRAVAAWCDRGDALQPLQCLPDAERQLASAIARVQCEVIAFYGRWIIQGRSIFDIHEKWRPMVERYIAART